MESSHARPGEPERPAHRRGRARAAKPHGEGFIMSLKDTVTKGDHLKSLIALRDRLADEIDRATMARDIGTLSKNLVDVLEQIALIKPPEGSVIDELGAKRDERRRSVAVPESDAKVPKQS